ncbi:MAG TPA: CcmD family protein [Longimicrobiaceae bacterium]|nr:CcmD family protein [Longimicrobiaceae bacterium]
MRRLHFVPFLALALALAPAPARAQATAGDSVVTEAASTEAAPAVQADGLPVRPTPPRTLRAYWHVFAAFAVAWVLLFGYALTIGRRFGALDREIRRLEGERPTA